jgi:hypothetical protein
MLMNMKKTTIILALLILFSSAACFAQSSVGLGFITPVGISERILDSRFIVRDEGVLSSMGMSDVDLFAAKKDMQDAKNWVVSPFKDALMFSALLFHAIGFGLGVGAGPISVLDFGLGALFMGIGAGCSSIGALSTHIQLAIVQDRYKAKGYKFGEYGQGLSLALSIITTALAAFSLTSTLYIPGTAGTITMLASGGTAVIIDIINMMAVQREWLVKVNTVLVR